MKENGQKDFKSQKGKRTRMRRVLTALAVVALVLVCTAGVCFLYVNDYYHRTGDVPGYLEDTDQVKVSEFEYGLFFDGSGEDTAFIFYPGAKVEYTAYAPLMQKLACQGIDCFLVHMPGNLAVLGQDRADSILDSFDYEHWYIGGHSLGGAMAASYAASNLDKFDGAVLLGAYPTKSLKSEAFAVLSVYGSEDTVINREKLEAGREYMPQDYNEVCIQGGNHAQFGNYGEQDKDGTAAISREEQQEQTVSAIAEMVRGQ